MNRLSAEGRCLFKLMPLGRRDCPDACRKSWRKGKGFTASRRMVSAPAVLAHIKSTGIWSYQGRRQQPRRCRVSGLLRLQPDLPHRPQQGVGTMVDTTGPL